MLQVPFDPGVHGIIGISALSLDASLTPLVISSAVLVFSAPLYDENV